MKTYQFKVKEHEEYGSLGFTPSWYPNGDPLGGMAVAHDILEHFPKDSGDAEGEFMALGASYRIRGKTGYMQKKGNVNPPEVHLASDFPQIFQTTQERNGNTTIRPTKKVKIAEDVWQAFHAIVENGKNLLESEFEQGHLLADEDKEKIVDWMALGYHKAGQRYKNIDFYTLAYTVFSTIESESDRELENAEEGMILTVKVNIKDLSVIMSLDYPE